MMVLACATNSCSSGKVAGLIFYLTFAYIWTSQVIGKLVSLATNILADSDTDGMTRLQRLSP
jgi:hypothetical protein